MPSRGAFVALTVGGIMVYSGLKGLSVLQVLAGEKGHTLDPTGGHYDPAQGASAAQGPRAVSASVEALVAEGDRMIAREQPYKWGGGHASFSPDGPWDCSGAVSWLMHYAGLLSTGSPITSTGFMREGEPGRGKDFTIYANPAHVFVRFESGSKRGQSWGTTSRIGGKGSLRWHNHTTAGFTARHYAGH